MKNIKVVVLLLTLTSTLLFSCERELETEGLSRLTYYPILTMKGDQWNSIPVGGSFTDPGVAATEADASIPVTTSGTVNAAVPGVYTITYTATNKDGYSASMRRYIGVIDPTATTNIAGSYKRDAGAMGVSQVTPVAGVLNLYQTDNVGGVAQGGPATTVRFYYYAPGMLGIPAQDVNGSEFSATNSTIVEGQKYSWIVVNSGYGPALRNFIKQ